MVRIPLESLHRNVYMCDHAYSVPSESPAILSTNVTRNSVSLAWSAVPVHQQNGDIISYRIIAYIGGTANGGRDTLGFEVPPSEHRFTFDARPFTEYILGVAAVNLVGQGPLSDTVMVRTEEDGECKRIAHLSFTESFCRSNP